MIVENYKKGKSPETGPENEMENCIFCKIANGEIPSTTLYEDDMFRVIFDLGPASKGHALILPKEHFADATELSEEYAAKVLLVGAKIGKVMKKALGCTGFNLVQNNGLSAGQTIFHFHMHVIPRYDDGAKIVAWDPGTLDPEEAKEMQKKISEALD